jgi:hypothetical protein
MADVYAADDALRDGRTDASLANAVEFLVSAAADPDVLGRIANQFNFANSAPWQFSMERIADGSLSFRIEMRGIAPGRVESIRRKLLQLTCVLEVSVASLPAPADLPGAAPHPAA